MKILLSKRSTLKEKQALNSTLTFFWLASVPASSQPYWYVWPRLAAEFSQHISSFPVGCRDKVIPLHCCIHCTYQVLRLHAPACGGSFQNVAKQESQYFHGQSRKRSEHMIYTALPKNQLICKLSCTVHDNLRISSCIWDPSAYERKKNMFCI